MPRQILFRAKSIEDDTKGQWIYGFYREFKTNKGITYFIDSGDSNESFFVDKATIGQYTGLNDKNGKKIFEGDKAINIGNGLGIVRFGTVFKNLGFDGTNHLAFYVEFDNTDLRRDLPYWADKIEVIGTIFDKEDC
ncbi:MAG: YopX family protein [Hydrogenoanaerobacterium sp.]